MPEPPVARARRTSVVGTTIAVLLGPITVFGIAWAIPGLRDYVPFFRAGRPSRPAPSPLDGSQVADEPEDADELPQPSSPPIDQSGAVDLVPEASTPPDTPSHGPPVQAADTTDRESQAAGLLRQAEIFRKRGNAEAAARWLRRIVEEFSETKAAESARRQLDAAP